LKAVVRKTIELDIEVAEKVKEFMQKSKKGFKEIVQTAIENHIYEENEKVKQLNKEEV
jgi:hypothetical protein